MTAHHPVQRFATAASGRAANGVQRPQAALPKRFESQTSTRTGLNRPSPGTTNARRYLGEAGRKKRISSFTVAVWCLAVVYALLMIPELVALFNQPNAIPESANWLRSFWGRDVFGLLRNTVSGSGMLFAAGTIIEQIDCIRWNARNREASHTA
jgi:hypothetical protein